MTTVVLDTNALMMPVEMGVRVFEELDRLVDPTDPVVPASVVAELDDLATGGGEEGRAASVGRDLVERCRVVETAADYADDAVVELATNGVPPTPTPRPSPSANDVSTDADNVSTEPDDTPTETERAAFDGYVVTNDGPLRDRVLSRGVRVIGIRGANTLAVTEP
ncbi:PIN domain-containing protein [Halobaculum sp. MBLA0147]|uniref:PIN domain-containing protein n=1 Tax=Halobaculum sp. MBLA0147 TaxID=3079934 RepID=UPI003524FD93